MTHVIDETCVGCGACKRVCPVDAIAGEPKRFHDIDPRVCVDCGACGIVCPVSCIADQFGVIYQFLKPKERPKAVVDELNCSGCTYCVVICPTQVLEVHDLGEGLGTAAFNARPNQCISCQQCVFICPLGTVSMQVPEAEKKPEGEKKGGDKVA